MTRLIPAFGLVALLLSACGGDDADSAATIPPPSSALSITADNAATAVGTAYRSANQGAESGDLVAASPVVGGFATTVGRTLDGALAAAAQAIPIPPINVPCEQDGSVTVSGSVTNPDTLTTGDNFTLEFSGCDDGLGQRVDGTIDLAVEEFAGNLDTQMFLLRMAVDFLNLQVAADNDVFTKNGDALVVLDTRSLPFVAASVSGNAMVTDANGRSVTLHDYAVAKTVDNGVAEAPPYTLTGEGTVETSELEGSLDFSTPVPFQGVVGGYPYAGELLVTGAGGSSARLVALDAERVRIDVDTDGDTEIDRRIETTWAEIDG